MGVLEYAVKTIGPDRILFGSDFTINDPSTVIARIQNAFLSEEVKRKILTENVEALLKKFAAELKLPFKPVAADVDGISVAVAFPDVAFPDLQRAVLRNGLRVVIATRPSVPVVRVSLLFDAGYVADQGRKLGTSSFTRGEVQ